MHTKKKTVFIKQASRFDSAESITPFTDVNTNSLSLVNTLPTLLDGEDNQPIGLGTAVAWPHLRSMLITSPTWATWCGHSECTSLFEKHIGRIEAGCTTTRNSTYSVHNIVAGVSPQF